jgi:hypothetical protein
MTEKETIGLIINLIVWPLLIYWIVKGQISGNEIKRNYKDYEKPENKFKRELKRLNLSLSTFSNRYHYPYILEPSFSDKLKASSATLMNNKMERYILDKVTTGKSEYSLYQYLTNRFGTDKILWGNYSLFGYYPDILYVDNNTKTYIDIEIDEPYSFKTNEPIHYLHADIENKQFIDTNKERDKAFLKYGWTVVRFSEKQVLESIDSCGDIINHIISYWTLTPSKHNLDQSKIMLHKRWTKEDANKMSSEKYREAEPIQLDKTDFDSELRNLSNDSSLT